MTQPSTSPRCSPENLTLFYYGELEEAERLRVANHLQQCGACRQELAQLRTTLDLLPRKEQKISPSELHAFNQRVSRRLRPAQRNAFGPALGWSLATATTVLLLVTLSPLSPVPRQPSPERAPQLSGVVQQLPDPDLLLNMELLEKLDLLQELVGSGGNG